jgi:hypothetical protein
MPASTVFDFVSTSQATTAIDARELLAVAITGASDPGPVRQVLVYIPTFTFSSGDIPEGEAFTLYALWRSRLDDLAT